MAQTVDVIVPVYNREKDIPVLIDEMKKQTFTRFRMIFIDDGSTDNSWAVLNAALVNAPFEYLLVQKRNGGAGAARNTGIRVANADWICFVDSDDALHPQFLEHMVRAAQDAAAQISICRFKAFGEGVRAQDIVRAPLQYRRITAAQGMHAFLTEWISPCCLLINREFQQENALFFDEQCRYCEDLPFVASVIAAAQQLAMIDRELYFYYTHQGSLHRSPSLDKFISGMDCFDKTAQRISMEQSPAADAFRQSGTARYYIATLRRAAVQLPRRDFLALARIVNFAQYRNQVSCLPNTQKLASYLMLTSKNLFYYINRMLFND